MEIEVKKIYTFTGHRDCVYELCRSGSSNIFFSAAGDGMVVEWDLARPGDGTLVAKIPSSIYALCYIDENKLIAGQNFEGIHEIDIISRKEIRSLKLTAHAIFDIKVYENNLFVATGGGEIIIVDKNNFNIIHRLQPCEKSARTIAISPLNQTFAVGFSDHSIRVYNLKDFSLQNNFTSHKNSVFSVVYSPGQQFLLSGSRDAHLNIWETGNYSLHQTIVAHLYAINDISFSPDNKFFITASMDKSIKVWDAQSFKLLKVIDKARHAGHGTSINKLLWTKYKDIFISASDDRTISAWKLNFKF